MSRVFSFTFNVAGNFLGAANQMAGGLNLINRAAASLSGMLGRVANSLNTIEKQGVKSVQGLGTQAQKTGSAFGGLTKQVLGLAAAYAGVAAARKALSSAEDQVQAEQRLTAALRENAGLLAERIKAQRSLQGASLFRPQELTDAEALLRVFGVTDRDIDKAMQLIVNRAAAMGTELEMQARQVGIVFSTGLQGELGEREDVVKRMSESARRSAQLFDTLGKKYDGFAKIVLASDFGKQISQQNQIEQQYIRFGKLLVQFTTQILPSVNAAFSQFIDVLGSPQGQAALQGITSFFTFLVNNSGKIIITLAALKGLSFLAGLAGGLRPLLGIVVSLVAGVTSFVSQWLLLPSIILALSAVVAEFLMQLTGANTHIGDTARILTDLVKRVTDGTISVKNTIAEIALNLKTEVRVLWTYAKAYLYDAPKALLTDFFAFLILEAQYAIAKIKLEIQRARSLIPTRFGGSTFEDVQRARGDVTSAGRALEEADRRTPFRDEIARADRDVAKIREDARLEALGRQKALNDRREIIDDRAQEAKLAAQTAKLEGDIAKATANRLGVEKRLVEAKLVKPEDTITDKDRIAEQLDVLDAAFQERQVKFEDYIKQREDATTLTVRKRLETLRAQAADIQKQLGIALEEEQDPDFDRLKTLQKIISLRTQEIANVNEVKRSEGELLKITGDNARFRAQIERARREEREAITNQLDERLRRANTLPGEETQTEAELKRIALAAKHTREWADAMRVLNHEEQVRLETVQLAEQVGLEREIQLNQATREAERVTQAREEYNRQILETNELVQSGSISFIQAQENNTSSQEQFNAVLQTTLDRLRAIREEATDPIVQQKIDEQINQVIGIAQKLNKDQLTIGKALGSTLQSNLAPALSDIITMSKSAKEAFADFAKGVAKGLADIAAKLIAMALIQQLLAGLGGLPIIGSFLNTKLPLGVTANKGGSIRRYAEGGYVPAMVTPGEYTYGPTVTSSLGVGLLSAINSRSLSRGVVATLAHGLVPGRGPNADVVPAAIADGSYVVNRGATDYYGAGLLSKIGNAPRAFVAALSSVIPGLPGVRKFATGGVVSLPGGTVVPTDERLYRDIRQRMLDAGAVGLPSVAALSYGIGPVQQSGNDRRSPVRGRTPFVPVLATDNQTADTIARGGDNALMEWATRNKESLRQMLRLNER